MARTSCTLRQVSSTSDEVMPWWMKRASGPTNSARWVRKAMTSCLTSRSMASMRSTSNFAAPPLSQMVLGGLLRDDAEFGQRVAGMRLDLEPDAELGLGRPDRDHLGAGIARDHDGASLSEFRVRSLRGGSVRTRRSRHRRMACDLALYAAGVPPLNTAEPATSTLAPAFVTSGAVSGVTPPSISMSIGRPPMSALHARHLVDASRG